MTNSCTQESSDGLWTVVSNEVQLRRRRRRRKAPAPRPPGRTRRVVRVLLLFVAAVVIVDAVVGDRGLLAMLRARHQYDQLAGTIARQRAENARLREEVRRLREDPA